VELESFGGTIALRRPGEPRPETERRRARERALLGPLDGGVVEGVLGEHLVD
jgi:hypothetical protein